MIPDGLARAVAKAVETGSSELEDVLVEPCTCAGNNRVFFVTARGTSLVAKKYFLGPGDHRDRFGAEVEFLRYARTAAPDCVPELLSADPESRVALFERIDGRRMQPGEVSWVHVGDALSFFAVLNRPELLNAAQRLPLASEACFSLAEHLDLVERRVLRLGGISERDELDGAAQEWIEGTLFPRWKKLKPAVAARAGTEGLSLDRELEGAERCVSPSDFGFHNALLRPSGRLCFFDFEYAGWDDPAKMALDFFCQPEVPVPMEYWEEFLATALGRGPADEAAVRRARVLFPVYQIKWVCIILNEFLSDSASRRRFADPGIDPTTRKRAQLEKARRLMERITI